MFEFNKMGFGKQEEDIFVKLIAVYDTKVLGKYRNVLLPENKVMYCAIYTADGNGILEMKNRERHNLPAHSLIFAKHTDVHSLICEKKSWHFHCYWFYYTGLDIPFGTVFTFSAVSDIAEQLFIDNILALLSQKIPRATAKANFLFAPKLLDWLEIFGIKQNGPKKFPIQAILTYINQNISSNLLIQNIAKHFGYCEKHFRNCFKAHIGKTPKQYVLDAKMKYACNMLTTSSVSIDEISQNLNFSSPYHFSNAFKNIFGTSPIEYRKSHRALSTSS